MLNSHLLVSGADFFADTFKINPYYSSSTIDIKKAQAEHTQIINCFKQAGIKITQVAPPQSSQDGVYTANWAIVKNNIAIISRLPKARQAEEPYAEHILQNLGLKTLHVPQNLLFSGQGDSLICGQYLFAGSGYRSDPAAQSFVADTLGLQLIQLHTIPQLNANGQPYINPATNHADSFFYDLVRPNSPLCQFVKFSSITTKLSTALLVISLVLAKPSSCPTKPPNFNKLSKAKALPASLPPSPNSKKAAVISVASHSLFNYLDFINFFKAFFTSSGS